MKLGLGLELGPGLDNKLEPETRRLGALFKLEPSRDEHSFELLLEPRINEFIMYVGSTVQ